MIFIRHNRLQKPFDNYEKLSIEQLDELAMGDISHEIQDVQLISPEIKRVLENCEKVICSTSIRTWQTAEQCLRLTGVKREIIIDANLNEITFTPSKIVEGEEDILSYLRSALYTHILNNGSHAESKENIENRIQSVLQKYEKENVVCFSHGFLIRLIHPYLKNRHHIDNALSFIDNESVVEYLGVRGER